MFYRLLTIFFFLFASVEVYSQAGTQDIVEKLNQHIAPIRTFQPDSGFNDIGFLKKLLGDKDIVGLGEGTHGTHEFFRYKDRLIRFMITELNFKAIAFESDFAAVMSLDAYINGKLASLRFLGGFPAGKETKEMLEWLREYNSSRPVKERVHVYGLEARGFRNISQLILDSITNISAPVETALTKLTTTAHNKLTNRDLAEIRSLIPSLKESANKGDHPEVHLQYLEILDQELIRSMQSEKRKLGMRDANMFENACWIQNQAADGKLIIWAHNGHVSKSNIFFQDPMGKLLCNKYGSKYYVIATDMNHGEVGVFAKRDKEIKYMNLYYPPIVSPRGYEYIFSQCKFDNFLLDLKKASEDSLLSAFLKKPLHMRFIGGTEKPSDSELSLLDCFDLLAFFDRTSAQGSR